jgi:hypothetical protein
MFTPIWNIISNATYQKVTQIQHVEVISVANYNGLMINMSHNNKKYVLFTNMYMKMLTIEETKRYTSINNHLYINSLTKTTSNIISRVKVGTEVIMYSIAKDRNTAYVIKTRVSTVVNALLTVNNRRKVATVAVVITIANEKDLLWDGTLVRVNGKPFIVVDHKILEYDSVVKLVAVAVTAHDYTITSQIKNETEDNDH